MSMKTMYLVEAKTRLSMVGQEIAKVAALLEAADADIQTRHAPQLAALREQQAQIQADLALMREVDEDEWGEFSTDLDDALHKLAHGAETLESELKRVPA